MTKYPRRLFGIIIVSGVLLLGCVANASANEKSAHIVSLGTCWSGCNALIVTMDNGDLLALGDIATDLTKAQYATALAARVSQDLVFYQVTTTQTICGLTRGSADWWVIGGSVY